MWIILEITRCSISLRRAKIRSAPFVVINFTTWRILMKYYTHINANEQSITSPAFRLSNPFDVTRSTTALVHMRGHMWPKFMWKDTPKPPRHTSNINNIKPNPRNTELPVQCMALISDTPQNDHQQKATITARVFVDRVKLWNDAIGNIVTETAVVGCSASMKSHARE